MDLERVKFELSSKFIPKNTMLKNVEKWYNNDINKEE